MEVPCTNTTSLEVLQGEEGVAGLFLQSMKAGHSTALRASINGQEIHALLWSQLQTLEP